MPHQTPTYFQIFFFNFDYLNERIFPIAKPKQVYVPPHGHSHPKKKKTELENHFVLVLAAYNRITSWSYLVVLSDSKWTRKRRENLVNGKGGKFFIHGYRRFLSTYGHTLPIHLPTIDLVIL